jgi:hypothetical protein
MNGPLQFALPSEKAVDSLLPVILLEKRLQFVL